MKIFISTPIAEREFAGEIGAALRENGNEVSDAFHLGDAGSRAADVIAEVFNADLLVAILTGYNPNVLYEVGVAAAAGIPTLLTGAGEEPLPAALLSVPYLPPSGDPARDAQEVARRAASMAGSRSRPAHPAAGGSAKSRLSEAAESPAILASMSPRDFEGLLALFFEEQGFDVSVQGGGRDWGVDFVIDLGEPVAVQLKKVSGQSRVSTAAVSDFLSALAVAGVSLGVLVSTSDFTAGAMALAKVEGTRVALLTLEQLLADPALSSVVARMGEKAPPRKRMA